jgi:hypothetical protein
MPCVGALRIAPPVASEYLLVGAQEEDHEGQVVIEFKQVQV